MNTDAEVKIVKGHRLRCIDIQVNYSIPVCGESMGVIQNFTILKIVSKEESCGYKRGASLYDYFSCTNNHSLIPGRVTKKYCAKCICENA